MEIIYRTDIIPPAETIIELYNDAGLPRPTHDARRIAKMFANANVVVTAWEGDLLVGVARSISDFCWCTYLSDLAVRKNIQAKGIGRKLIEQTQERVGNQSMILLLSVPTAMEYYPKVGFEKMNSAFIIWRKE